MVARLIMSRLGSSVGHSCALFWCAQVRSHCAEVVLAVSLSVVCLTFPVRWVFAVAAARRSWVVTVALSAVLPVG